MARMTVSSPATAPNTSNANSIDVGEKVARYHAAGRLNHDPSRVRTFDVFEMTGPTGKVEMTLFVDANWPRNGEFKDAMKVVVDNPPDKVTAANDQLVANARDQLNELTNQGKEQGAVILRATDPVVDLVINAPRVEWGPI